MGIRWQDYIEERKDVMMGKPVFRGTRLTVQHVLAELGTGMTMDDLFSGYPQITPEHVRAAYLYGADLIALDESIFA